MDGIICVYKPQGYTSFDIIAIMRRLFNTKKIGHSGTLDPMAEGVLPVFIGAATKAIDFLPDTSKEYRAAFKFGVTTDTQDISGMVLSDNTPCYVPVTRLREVMERFKGEIEQIPPMYSAVKVNGRRLYDMARKGEVADRAPRKVTIKVLEVEEYNQTAAEGVFLVSCSKGTYIRTIIHDIGQELGFGGVMTALQRTDSNGFKLENCYNLNHLRNLYEQDPELLYKLLTPLESLFANYPKAYLDEKQTKMFKNGAVLDADLIKFDKIYDGVYAVMDSNGRIAALANIERDHSLTTIQRFNYGI